MREGESRGRERESSEGGREGGREGLERDRGSPTVRENRADRQV